MIPRRRAGSCLAALLDAHPDAAVLDPGRVDAKRFLPGHRSQQSAHSRRPGGPGFDLAGSEVEGAVVARTDDGRVFSDLAVLEGSTHVGADVVHGVDLALVAKEKDGVPFYMYDSVLGVRKLVVWKNIDPVHVVLLSRKDPVQRCSLLWCLLDWGSPISAKVLNSTWGRTIILARPPGANETLWSALARWDASSSIQQSPYSRLPRRWRFWLEPRPALC
jgi:hypothetical protein